jgi:transposase-like protein
MRREFTPANARAVIDAVREGLSIAEAAQKAGLSAKTVRNWLSRGRSEPADTPHAAFAAALEEARDEARDAALTEEEFYARLDRAVRAGSVQALRLWWQVHGTRDDEHPPDALDALRARRDERRQALETEAGCRSSLEEQSRSPGLVARARRPSGKVMTP